LTTDKNLSLTDGCEPVEIQIIAGEGKRRTVHANFSRFSDRTLYVVADESIETGATVWAEHNDLTITGEVERCEQEEDSGWVLEISLRYISTKMESLLRMRDVLAEYDSALNHVFVPMASVRRASS
jgi:hypothetical protein